MIQIHQKLQYDSHIDTSSSRLSNSCWWCPYSTSRGMAYLTLLQKFKIWSFNKGV